MKLDLATTHRAAAMPQRSSPRIAEALAGLIALSACTGSVDSGQRSFSDLNGDGIPDVPAGAPWGVAGAGGIGIPAGPAAPQGRIELPHASLRRLTLSQYQNSLQDLLNVTPDISALTPVAPRNGLRAIAASSVALPQRDLESFGTLADSASAQVFGDVNARMKLVGCDASQSACADSFVAAFARRAFRRPLLPDESARYLALLRKATQQSGDGWLGLRVVTSALLQSPHFLYRSELGEADAADPARRKLSDYELAARLSFFLWNTTPDDALLAAADSGKLATAPGRSAEVQRLLASPRAAQAVEELFSDYLQLEALDALVKLPEVYPQATPSLAAAMKQETLLALRSALFERGGDFRDAFRSTKTFANAELAALYGLRAPSGGAFAEVELPASGPRAGLLMQASFLAAHAHPSRSSPTRRGKFVRESLLCQSIPAPPDDVNTTLTDTSTAKTLREKLTAHRSDARCAGCHMLMDPIGLALEHFDGIGAFRDTENGARIDASGELDGRTFQDARGLAEALAAHPQLADCFARTLLRYARGALETASETPALQSLTQQFAAAGHRLPDLMARIANDPSFAQVGPLP
jgi:hypothetical protein